MFTGEYTRKRLVESQEPRVYHNGALLVPEDMGDYAAENSAVLDLIDRAHKDLLCADGAETATNSVNSDFVLCVAEMCRLAQASVSENLDQSIATHLGGSKKKQPMWLHVSYLTGL